MLPAAVVEGKNGLLRFPFRVGVERGLDTQLVLGLCGGTIPRQGERAPEDPDVAVDAQHESGAGDDDEHDRERAAEAHDGCRVPYAGCAGIVNAAPGPAYVPELSMAVSSTAARRWMPNGFTT